MDDVTAEFNLGGDAAEFLNVAVRHRELPAHNDYWDGNWLSCEIRVAVGRFKGRVDAALRAEDFVGFLEEVRQLQKSLNGRADFTTLEGWLSVEMIGDGRGHLTVNCTLLDQPGIGNRLMFKLNMDQTHLPTVIAGLERIVSVHQVRGKP